MQLDKRCDLIAIPFKKGGVYDFWCFVKDSGQDLEYGAFRIPAYKLTDLDSLAKILKMEKARLTADSMCKATATMRLSRATKVYAGALRTNNKTQVYGF